MRNEIVYEEGWRDQVPSPEEEPRLDEQGEVPVPQPQSLPLLISIQLVLCVVTAAALCILRAMDSEVYRDFMTAYNAEMNKPVISQDFFEALDIRRLAGAGGAEAQASPDELPRG